MPSSLLTELALRTAVNTTKTDIAKEDAASEVEKSAISRVTKLIEASTDAASKDAAIKQEARLIGVAMAGLAIGYKVVKHQVGKLKQERLNFDKERQAGIATFFLSSQVEESDLSKEEAVAKHFFELSQRQAGFAHYLGIKSSELEGQEEGFFYSVLPYYKLSAHLAKPVASKERIDIERITIGLFFRTAIPEAIEDIDYDFQTDNKLVEFFKSTFQGSNYLNHLRVPRIIIMSLANLLWNLQYPVDLKTGYPLSLSERIRLCRDIESYLDVLLDREYQPDLKSISNTDINLIDFVRQVQLHVKELKQGFVEEQLHAVNIADVVHSAHRTLRIMGESLFKLLYRRKNPVTNKTLPDKHASEMIVYQVAYINDLIKKDPSLLAFFQGKAEVPQATLINSPATTVIDIFIMLASMTDKQRKRLIRRVEKKKTGAALQLTKCLRIVNKRFIKPVYEMCKTELDTGIYFSDSEKEAVKTLMIKRFIPLVTLLCEDYRIEVDTPESLKKSVALDALGLRFHSGEEQVRTINKMAAGESDTYTWSISPFIQSGSQLLHALDELPVRKYRLTKISELLDAIQELIEHYRSFLQLPRFQHFLLDFMDIVRDEYDALGDFLDTINFHVETDENVGRTLKLILRPMTKEINANLGNFAEAVKYFEAKVSQPNFTVDQKREMRRKIADIEGQFKELFERDAKLYDMVDELDLGLGDEVAADVDVVDGEHHELDIVPANQVIALYDLVKACHHSLSWGSRWSRKESLLQGLLNMITKARHFSRDELKQCLLALFRITAAFRPSYFFQAQYGETTASKVLVKAILQSHQDRHLPLLEVLFDGEELPDGEALIDGLNEGMVIHRLNQLRETHRWSDNSTELQRLNF